MRLAFHCNGETILWRDSYDSPLFFEKLLAFRLQSGEARGPSALVLPFKAEHTHRWKGQKVVTRCDCHSFLQRDNVQSSNPIYVIGALQILTSRLCACVVICEDAPVNVANFVAFDLCPSIPSKMVARHVHNPIAHLSTTALQI